MYLSESRSNKNSKYFSKTKSRSILYKESNGALLLRYYLTNIGSPLHVGCGQPSEVSLYLKTIILKILMKGETEFWREVGNFKNMGDRILKHRSDI